MRHTFSLLFAAVLVMVLPGLSGATLPDYAQDVTYRNADPSPNASDSNINDYTFQDEQLNLDPDDGQIRILRTNQKVLLNDYVSAIIPLNNASPRELRGPIRTLVRKEGGEADVLQDKVNNQNYLQVTCPAFQLSYVEAAIKALDEEWVKERIDGSAEMYYLAKFRDIEKVLNITRFYVSPEFVFRVDKNNNALFYRDQPPLIGLQNWGLSQVDIPPNQMMMDVAIYEVSTANNLLLGHDFLSWKNGPGRNLFRVAYGWARDVVDIDIPGGKIHTTDKSGPFLYAAYDAVLLSSYVDFLRTKGKARLLNRSQVTAKSGYPATVTTVDDVVTFERTLGAYSSPEIDPTGLGGIVPPEGEEVDVELTSYRQPTLDYVKQDATVGINVTILPVIGQKSSEVGVRVEVSDINGFTPAGTPIIEKREVDSKVTLAPGEPYVIGGLTRKANVSATGKVPLLGSIPVLGYLFGHETESASESQVIIVLTPAVTLNAESIIAMPAEAQTAKAIVDSADFPEVPKTRFGFDQWLLDEDK